MFPSELPREYDEYGFDRGRLLKFLSALGINSATTDFYINESEKIDATPEWAKSCRAIKRLTLEQASRVLLKIDPVDTQWLGDDLYREFKRVFTSLLQAVEDGDLNQVGEDENRNKLFRAQDLRTWAESVGLEWCIPSDALTTAVTDSATLDRLRQLEAENARLVEQVANLEAEKADANEEVKYIQRRFLEMADQRDELQRQRQEATPVPQQAEPSTPESAPVQRWPWGEHHTEALGHLEAAGVRFWQWFDPTDHTTAKTNEVVIEWLVTERNASKEKARAIASILRADGIPPGPRR